MTDSRPPADPRVAVVTGAGSGIGRAVARLMLADGYRVALAGRREAQLLETADGHPERTGGALRRHGARRRRAPFRSRPPAVGEGGCALQQRRRLRARRRRWMRSASPTGNATVAVNLTGSMLCAAAAVRAMKAQNPQGGRIINNGSISAHSPRPRTVAYAVTKHAMTGLTKSIELDGRAFGITCGQIDIGNTATEIMDTIGVGSGALQADGTPQSRAHVPRGGRRPCRAHDGRHAAVGQRGLRGHHGRRHAVHRPRLAHALLAPFRCAVGHPRRGFTRGRMSEARSGFSRAQHRLHLISAIWKLIFPLRNSVTGVTLETDPDLRGCSRLIGTDQ